MDLLDRVLRALRLVEDNERLAPALDVVLGDDLDDISELFEDGPQGGVEGLGLDSLFEIPDVDAVRLVSEVRHRDVSECNDTHVQMGSEAIMKASIRLR